MSKKEESVKKNDNFSDWYIHVLIDTEFIDYSSVSGCIVLRPDSYFVWEVISRETDKKFKKMGITNTYFPLLIPEKLLNKEKEHIAGFSPEVAWVTQTGDAVLDERLAIRPTSEVIMYDSVAKWVRSWRDLPMRLNQWNNVIRWEFKHPTPFLRTREFLWNEGHTIFATEEEANAERQEIIATYVSILKDYLALSGVPGRKTDTEKFAGAESSYSIEHVLPDGKAVQGPDFHHDGQRFSKAFNISFIDKDESRKYAYQNTFAISTRVIGVMVATHGDDKGLVIPPKLARIQLVIIPIYNDDTKPIVMENSLRLFNDLKGNFRAHIDDRDSYSPGWKFHEWELRGVPIRIEIGAREIEKGEVVVVRRDTGAKLATLQSSLPDKLSEILNDIHNDMYANAKRFLEKNIHKVSDYNGLKDVIANKGGMAQAPWCGSSDCEAKIKEETGAKATNMPFDSQNDRAGKKCVYCGKDAKHIVNFAKSY